MLTYSKPYTPAGSNSKRIDVSKDGYPFGQLWTFRNTKTTTHPWHALPLKGDHRAFYKADGGLPAAKAYMEEHA